MKKQSYIIGMILLLAATVAGAVIFYAHYSDHIYDSDLKIKGYRSMTVYLPKPGKMTRKELDEAVMTRLNKEGIVHKIIDCPIKKGDIVNLDYKEYLVSKKRPLRKGDDINLEIGSGMFPKKFEEKLIGKYPNKTIAFDLKYPKKYQDLKVAGRKVRFVIRVHYIKESYMIETLTDEVVHEQSSYKSAKDFCHIIQKEYKKEQEKDFEKKKAEAMWKELDQRTMIRSYEKKALEQEYIIFEKTCQTHANALGMDQETYIKEVCGYTKEEYQKKKEKFCKASLKQKMIVNAIAKKENIKANNDDKRKQAVETYLCKYVKVKEK